MPLSPMMQQYLKIKQENSDCIILFRLGDFYEMFFDDAIEISKALELTLTGRDCGLEERAPMCGVPYHAVDTYLARMIELGYRVAICEQLQDPKTTKGLVDRGVTRIITPGTLREQSLLSETKNNYLLYVFARQGEIGLAYCDISTGELILEQIKNQQALVDSVFRIDPAEILSNEAAAFMLTGLAGKKPRVYTPDMDSRQAYNKLKELVGEESAVKAKDKRACVLASGALLNYLDYTQKGAQTGITNLTLYSNTRHMVLDPNAMRNLELTSPLYGEDRSGTLFTLLNKCACSMGARTLRGYIENPLCDIEAINQRLDAVAELASDYVASSTLKTHIGEIYDIERLSSKIAFGTLNGRDCIALSKSLKNLPGIRSQLLDKNSALLSAILQDLDELDDVVDLIDRAISLDAPITITEGGVIKEGYNAEADRLRDISKNGVSYIRDLEQQERELTGIKNLKIGYNRVFGYYIEVTKSQYELVPLRYTRKQTLATAERYVTKELKELEDSVTSAQEKLMKLEYQLFTDIRDKLYANLSRIKQTAGAIKELDALNALAICATSYDYVRPDLHTGYETIIKDGRHPVIEQTGSESFVPNDVTLTEDERLLVVTGPNMAGKSTYMRQVALITLMAHIGSFVPASYAKISLTDKIFTRIGASDNISAGQSTFMVEMTELSDILKNATERSLLILDEIGRGTSTFDGMAIAWAAVEHISNRKKLGAKTLFATHYHELSELEGSLEGVVNYRIDVKEHGSEIIFLRKIMRGGADRSFGVQVAAMSGLPKGLVRRAMEIMARLEARDINQKAIGATLLDDPKPKGGQMDFMAVPYIELANELAAIDVNSMTPMDALNTLYRIVEKAKLI